VQSALLIVSLNKQKTNKQTRK